MAIGLYIGARRELLATLRDRADRAEREQAMRVAQARTNERSRIAREMHDVLAHRISLVAMHAGALAYRTDLTPQETTEAADVIQKNAHQALVDLREILGVLRDTDSAADRGAPAADPWATCRPLIEDERGAGARIRLTSTVPLDAGARRRSAGTRSGWSRRASRTPASTRRTRRSTSTWRASPAARCGVEVRNPLRVGAVASAVPGSGLGLIGLSERADLSGGGLEHFTTPEGDFVLRAWLPWPT